MNSLQSFYASLTGLSFTCQPADRPLQTITVLSVDQGQAQCRVVARTKTGAISAQTVTMKVSTLAERMEAAVDQPAVTEVAVAAAA